MIELKQKNPNAKPSTSDLNSQMGFEEAVAKGKLYNPLSGRELFELIIKRLHFILSDAPLDAEVAIYAENNIRLQLSRHPNFESELIAYPKAQVEFKIMFYTPLPEPAAGTGIQFFYSIRQWPFEENRGFSQALSFRYPDSNWTGQPLQLETEWNMDEIPPDATRILNDMPVPIAQRILGSGPDGEATIIDKEKLAPEQQRAAVERQYRKETRENGETEKSNRPNRPNR